MAMTTGVSRIVHRDNISPDFIAYTEALGDARKRYYLYSPHKSFLRYAHSKGDTMKLLRFSSVKTDLVAIRWETIAAYYNATPIRRYGQWSRMNAARLSFLNDIPEETAAEIVHYASAGQWKLRRYDMHDYYIEQSFNESHSIINVIDLNFAITYLIGKIAMVHADVY